MKEKFTYFWKAESLFSQWYPAVFTVDDVQFHSAKQFMIYRKALLFEDEEMARKILEASSPMDTLNFRFLIALTFCVVYMKLAKIPIHIDFRRLLPLLLPPSSTSLSSANFYANSVNTP